MVVNGEFVMLWICLAILAGSVLSFALSNEGARLAAIFALPQRRSIMQSKLVSESVIATRLCRMIWTQNNRDVYGLGKVDLRQFGRDTLSVSPLLRKDILVRTVKRVVDILLSATLLLVTLPVLILVAIAVKMDSAGPLFYRQTRMGRDGALFKVIKFRTMTVDAEKDGAVWAAKNDQRVTGVGRFLRRSRLDEIPQAITILMGDMSFVGPRPERPEFMDELETAIPHYAVRLKVKPGLTGWAQVNYPYGASIDDAREKLAYDLYYIKHYSLLLDLFIVVKTVRVALFSKDAR